MSQTLPALNVPAVIGRELPRGWRPLRLAYTRGWDASVEVNLLYDPDGTYGTLAAYELVEPPWYVEVSLRFEAIPDWDWVRAYLYACQSAPRAIRADVLSRPLR